MAVYIYCPRATLSLVKRAFCQCQSGLFVRPHRAPICDSQLMPAKCLVTCVLALSQSRIF